ncbi:MULTISPECIES: TRAP transporter large permease [Thalassobaculum]|uniref:TRAP transporter large permease protein n=1 Tax=Thalassobaculum litoreum DSM 18839 TaxID=1123362 RepID=A0A8G2BH73_9PROT|nr:MULTISPECIES: TRAP transporter large permease subunit [Thalassobaculum]SDF67619.1 TRAP transporter, DctM subunit [Thalassobaculum litoreum DSM 18839]
MDAGVISLILFVLLLALLASGLWVAPTLIAVGYVALGVFSPAPAGTLLASTVWDASWNWALTALPLFVWMGEILFRTRLSSDMFTGLAPWTSRLPGGLLHVNILGCGVMAAVAGSSAVTCATVGRMSMPELRKRGYDEGLAIGTLAGSGTLGLLIPPSIMLIVYGVVAQVSISRLFIAGIVPGVMIIAIFMTYVAIRSSLNPSLAPKPDRHLSFGEKLWASRFLIPVMGLIFVVLGSIYGGFATPTEAATIGVIGALVLAAVSRSLTWDSFMESLMGAVRTSCMIAFILAGAAFLSIAMGFTGVPRVLAGYVDAWNLSPFALIALLTVLYIFLGCFLDGVSMMVLTAAVVLPMVEKAGIDLLWFGIFTVIVVEMAQITPPVGFNLFVLQGMTGRDILKVTKAAMPFFALMLLGILIITLVPEIVLAPVQFMLSK